MSEHIHSREENYRLVRAICSCGWRGKWRARSAFLVERQLHSDDGQHLYAVRRASAAEPVPAYYCRACGHPEYVGTPDNQCTRCGERNPL